MEKEKSLHIDETTMFYQLASEAFPLKKNPTAIERMANQQDRNCFIAGCTAAQKLTENDKQLCILESTFNLLGKIKEDIERLMSGEQDLENFATIIYLKYDTTYAEKYNKEIEMGIES